MKKVLSVSVHPDDETLGCGGTLLKHKDKGDELFCIHVTNGNAQQASIVTQIDISFGFKESIQLGFKENVLANTSLVDIIKGLSNAISHVKPNYIYIPNRSDAHSDHRRVFEALIACTKSFRYPFIKKIMMCEVISETDFSPALYENCFIPNIFVDISGYMEKKLEIIKIFESELLMDTFTRSWSSIDALSRYRGSQINVKYAEAFMLIKEIL
jgi:LmbE family N-acetylglucosaminyl deacetylase